MPESVSLSGRLERLLRSTNELRADMPLDEVLQWIADQARAQLGARYAAIGLLAPDKRTLESFTTSGLSPDARERIGDLPVGRGILGLVVREARPVRLRNLMEHPHAVGFPPNHPPMRSFLGVPVRGRHEVLGNLYFTEKEGAGEFSEEDQYLATLFADKAAGAVEAARAFGESERLLVEVQKLLRARERFFATVNHELRNSLAAVLGWAEMLVRKKDPATVPRAAFEVFEAAEAAAGLISDLLDLSRLDEDRLQPAIRTADCGGILRRAVGRVTPVARAKPVTLAPAYPEALLTCDTDASRVEQILVNLLINAVRHAPPDSTVRVSAGNADGQVYMAVADEGPGVPEEEMERIFDVYYTHEAAGQGIGLGLPLSRRLARLLGGDLTVANRPEGGAVFTLRLPLPGAPA